MRNRAILVLLGAQLLSAQATGGLRGMVVDPGRVGAPGVRIELRNTASCAVAHTTSLPDGSFRFDGLAPATYEITIRSWSGFRDEQLKDVVVSAGQVRELPPIELKLATLILYEVLTPPSPPGGLRGIVVDPGRVGVPGIEISARGKSTGVVTPTESHDDGSFRLEYLTPGTYEIAIKPWGCYGGTQLQDVVVGSGQTRELPPIELNIVR
jgi:hypothetical protein